MTITRIPETGGIEFTSTTSFPFGSELRVIGPPLAGGSCRVSVQYPNLGLADIQIKQGQFTPATFVVFGHYAIGEQLRYVAASTESVVRQAQTIEDAIIVALGGLSQNGK